MYYDLGGMVAVLGLRTYRSSSLVSAYTYKYIEDVKLKDVVHVFDMLPQIVVCDEKSYTISSYTDLGKLTEDLSISAEWFWPLWKISQDWQFILDIARQQVKNRHVPEEVIARIEVLVCEGYLPCYDGWVRKTSSGWRYSLQPKSHLIVPFEKYKDLSPWYPYGIDARSCKDVHDWVLGIYKEEEVKAPSAQRIEPPPPYDFIIRHTTPKVTRYDKVKHICEYVEMEIAFPVSYSRSDVRKVAQQNIKGIWQYFLDVTHSYTKYDLSGGHFVPKTITALNTRYLHIVANFVEDKHGEKE